MIKRGRRKRDSDLAIALPTANFQFGEALKSPVASIEGENLDGDDTNDMYHTAIDDNEDEDDDLGDGADVEGQ